jgi:hypothetical protein
MKEFDTKLLTLSIKDEELLRVEKEIEYRFHIPASDMLKEGTDKVVNAILKSFPNLKNKLHAKNKSSNLG